MSGDQVEGSQDYDDENLDDDAGVGKIMIMNY